LSGVFGAFAGVASALAGKGVVVQGAFSLMARAFADYRNAAIPAMVGTSRLLAALNLPIESRATGGGVHPVTGGQTAHCGGKRKE